MHFAVVVARGGTLGISGWGRAAGTLLEPLTYTRASSAEFCYPIYGSTPPPGIVDIFLISFISFYTFVDEEG